MATTAFFRSRPQMKLAKVQADGPLWAEIDSLRSEALHERERCDERIGRIEDRHSTDISKLEGKIRVIRHERNNIRSGWNALLALLKRLDNPQLSEIAATVEAMVQKGDEIIAVERAAMSDGTRSPGG